MATNESPAWIRLSVVDLSVATQRRHWLRDVTSYRGAGPRQANHHRHDSQHTDRSCGQAAKEAGVSAPARPARPRLRGHAVRVVHECGNTHRLASYAPATDPPAVRPQNVCGHWPSRSRLLAVAQSRLEGDMGRRLTLWLLVLVAIVVVVIVIVIVIVVGKRQRFAQRALESPAPGHAQLGSLRSRHRA
jgi:hypothetical protein